MIREEMKEDLKYAVHEMSLAVTKLSGCISRKEVPEETVKQTLETIEKRFSQLTDLLNYDSPLTKERKETTRRISLLNQEIRELKEKIGSEKPVEGLQEQLKYLSKTIKQWWDEEGFCHIQAISFTEYGAVEIVFSFMLDHYRQRGKSKSKKEHIQSLRDRGFVFADFEESEAEKLYLIDTPKNRKELSRLVKERFPSIHLHTFTSQDSWKEEDIYKIQTFHATIEEIEDIEIK